MNLQRTRYQQGSLTIERRSKSSPVWVYRWWEKDQSGRLSRRKQIVGQKSIDGTCNRGLAVGFVAFIRYYLSIARCGHKLLVQISML